MNLQIVDKNNHLKNKSYDNYILNEHRLYTNGSHWVHENGGRMVGEACHIIDLMTAIMGSEIESVFSEAITPSNEKYSTDDNKSIVLKYKDGSVANIEYFSNGSKEPSKEFMEIHFDGKT